MAVAILVEGVQDAGYRYVDWNAGSLSSGAYFCRLEAVDINDPGNMFTQVRQMMLIK